MSCPSTPRTTRSASAAPASPEILTPGKKIKAMLAAFDSDSDSDGAKSDNRKTSATLFNPLTNKSTSAGPFAMDSDDDDDEEEDDDIIKPRGRMAARLQGHATNEDSDMPGEAPATETAFERVSKALRRGTDDPRHDSAEDKEMSSDDDLPTAGLRRNIRDAQATDNTDGDLDRSRSRSRCLSRARAFSPLFVSSPVRGQDNGEERSDEADPEDEEAMPKSNNRFLALVARKRKEREERERIEAEMKAARAKERERISSDVIADDVGADEAGSGRKSKQKARPGRKASKKALEEMTRETQRMSRNMQLAHEARTKKKITKESFFARFNFMQPDQPTASDQPGENSSTTGDSQHSSDVEAQKDKETPHTSPILEPLSKPSTEVAKDSSEEAEVTFSSLEELMNGEYQQTENVIAAVTEHQMTKSNSELSEVQNGKLPVRVAPVRVRLSRQQVAQHQKDDSDSDLEIVTSPAICRRIAAFENLPARKVQEPEAMFKLKTLAHLTSPSRNSTMNSAELSATLLYKAKQQAAQERKERIEELRARGIVVETAAERAALEDEIENLVEKARQEGEEIARKEREAEKREKGGDQDHDDDDDSDFELSGSEDEEGGDHVEGDEEDEEDEEDDENEDDDEDEVDADAKAEGKGNLFQFEADEAEDEQSEDVGAVDPPLEQSSLPTQRRKRHTRVISDDEDEDQAPKTPAKPINPFLNSVERPVIPVDRSEATMSLTQAFAGTLAGSQDMSQQDTSTIPQTLPDPVPMSIHEPDSQVVIKDSQEQRARTTDLLAGYSQMEPRVSESPAPQSISQMSQIPDPTQDAGFILSPFDPNKRFLGTPTSTIETVLVDQNYSPIAARKSRNLRRGKVRELSVVEEQRESGFEIDVSAFDVMKKAAKKAKKPSDAFDRNKSMAKEVVEDAAEESDDEYAGLGGASDDDVSDEENAYDREMINDNSGEVVDAKQLAALNALHQRNADEKDVAKLLKDITTGALRRRRGPDDEFDLDDSDDELLARRRQKQREFARMRNALLADGKVGELAENPKKAAFFKAIEDRDEDDDFGLDFLGNEQEGRSQDKPSSQDGGSETQPNTVPAGEGSKRKRPLEPAAEDVNNRTPPHLRRKPASTMSKKPATLAEIRETVSFLTERPEYDSFHEDASAEEDEDDQHADGGHQMDGPSVTSRHRDAFAAPSHPRRTRGPVVDRLALLRQASSNSANSASSNTRLAFYTGSGNDKASPLGFRPPMLRKTTTGSSSSSTTTSKSDSSRGVSKASGPTLSKKGAVNYYTAAREREREKQLRMQHRSRGSNTAALLNKHAGNRLGALGGTGQWD